MFVCVSSTRGGSRDERGWKSIEGGLTDVAAVGGGGRHVDGGVGRGEYEVILGTGSTGRPSSKPSDSKKVQ